MQLRTSEVGPVWQLCHCNVILWEVRHLTKRCNTWLPENRLQNKLNSGVTLSVTPRPHIILHLIQKLKAWYKYVASLFKVPFFQLPAEPAEQFLWRSTFCSSFSTAALESERWMWGLLWNRKAHLWSGWWAGFPCNFHYRVKRLFSLLSLFVNRKKHLLDYHIYIYHIDRYIGSWWSQPRFCCRVSLLVRQSPFQRLHCPTLLLLYINYI